jgi:hypothetical protein
MRERDKSVGRELCIADFKNLFKYYILLVMDITVSSLITKEECIYSVLRYANDSRSFAFAAASGGAAPQEPLEDPSFHPL